MKKKIPTILLSIVLIASVSLVIVFIPVQDNIGKKKLEKHLKTNDPDYQANKSVESHIDKAGGRLYIVTYADETDVRYHYNYSYGAGITLDYIAIKESASTKTLFDYTPENPPSLKHISDETLQQWFKENG